MTFDRATALSRLLVTVACGSLGGIGLAWLCGFDTGWHAVGEIYDAWFTLAMVWIGHRFLFGVGT